ncbi:MAG: phosphate signaling complex PhoU family protein [Planctomycetota bacterium]|jgi:phosphate uptake regulator
MIRDILKLLSKDNLQVQALSECYEMLDICHTMFRASVESLRNRDDANVEVDIYEKDKKVNQFERDVRRKVMTHLSLGHTADISAGLTLVSIVIDLERIGDYTKNIYDIAVNHPGRLHAGQQEEELKEIESAAMEMFDRAAKAFKEGDSDEARKLMGEYKQDVSKQSRRLEEELVAGKTELGVGEAVAVALYTRFLKRIAAHSRNLISSLVNPFDRIGYPEKNK